jgi:type IV pilus assembly protein PilX
MSRPNLFKSQSGVVLVVSLIMLLLLTLIGLSAMQSTGLEERMAGNMRDRNLAFQAAEAGLRDAEQYLESGAGPFNPLNLSAGPFKNTVAPLCVSGLCPVTNPTQWSVLSDADWPLRGKAYGGWQAGVGVAVPPAFPGVVAQPRYVIEFMGTCPLDTDVNRCVAPMRVTVRAWGANATTVVQLQSMYKLKVRSFAN